MEKTQHEGNQGTPTKPAQRVTDTAEQNQQSALRATQAHAHTNSLTITHSSPIGRMQGPTAPIQSCDRHMENKLADST